MQKFFYVTNNCLSGFINEKLNLPDDPFAWSMIQDDFQFLKLCQNFDYYLKLTPVFGEPILPGHIDPNKYLTMYLDDIQVDWFYECNKDALLEKFKRRVERTKNDAKPFFLWGDITTMQRHPTEERERLISEFQKIENSLYLRMEDVEAWKNYSVDDRINHGGWFQLTRASEELRWPSISDVFISHLH